MSPNLTAPFMPKNASLVNVYQDRETAPMWEQGLYVVWFFTLYLPIPQFSILRALCLLAILGLFTWHARTTIPLMLKAWPILPYPLFALLSVGWSPYPAAGLTLAILLLLTPVILITLASRLRPMEFIRVMMIAGSITAAYLISTSGSLHVDGGIMHKQILAYQLQLITIFSTACLLNSDEKSIYRWIALVTAPVAFMMQLYAESVTSLVLGIIAIAFLVGAKYVWSPFSRVRHLRTLTFMLVVTCLLVAALVFLSMPQNTVVKDFLELVGKDGTLTGRTMIWEVAEIVAQEKPVFGLGLGGFWQPDVGLAQTLAEVTFSDPGTNISFHSSYWEARVHVGWVGYACLIFAVSWTVWRTLTCWLKDGSIVNSAHLMLVVAVGATFLTESYLAGPFNPMVTSFYFGAIAAFGATNRKLMRQGRLVEHDGPLPARVPAE